MNNRIPILAHILLLVLSLSVYFWSDRNALDVQGPTRLVTGPDNTIIISVDKQIVKVTKDGDVLSTLNLDDMGIMEPIADLFVEPNGDLLIGLAESQHIRRYSPEGKLLGTHSRPPSASVVHDGRNFKFTKDHRSGMLYVADAGHHRVQIYGPDEQEKRVVDSYEAPVAIEDKYADAEHEAAGESEPGREIQFRFPNGLAINNDRLYVTDTHHSKVVVFGLDGSFEKAIPTISPGWTEFKYPVWFSISNNTLYVINRGPLYVEGEVVAVPLDGTGAEKFYPSNSGINPLDIFAREDDVLIADDNSKNILSYFPDGTYRTYFGKPSLLALLSGKKNREIAFKVVRVYATAGMITVLVSLLLLKRKDRTTREQLGLPSEHQPVAAIQDILGPEGSLRRALLLVLVPGLGYAAAGRALRAIMILPILLLCIVIFVACLVVYILNGVIYLWPVIGTGVITAMVWTAIVLDGKRLNEKEERRPQKFDLLKLILTFAVPLVTAATGGAAQLIREIFILRHNPDLSLAIHAFFQKVMVALHFMDTPEMLLAVGHPATFFLGWGGAVAGMFGTLAWGFRQSAARISLAAAVGFVVGMVSWILTATYAGPMLGSMYYMPLLQGLLVSTGVYLQFRKIVGSVFIIPAGIVGAWMGSIINIFSHFSLPFLNLGELTRMKVVVVQAYFMHLAILLAITLLERRKQYTAVPHTAPVSSPNPQ